MFFKVLFTLAFFAYTSNGLTVEEAQKNPLQAYVLTDQSGKVVPISGVRIGPLDLNYVTPQMLKRIGVSQDLMQKFEPYMNVRGEEAQKLLEQKPLKLSQEQYDQLSNKAIDFMDRLFERIPAPLKQNSTIMQIRQLAEQKQWPQFLVRLSQLLQRFQMSG